jgi:hypothetical protein
MTVYITKYAFTMGILTGEVSVDPDDSTVVKVDRAPDETYGRGTWHATFEEAQAEAEVQRDRRVLVLQERIDVLNALTFEEYT